MELHDNAGPRPVTNGRVENGVMNRVHIIDPIKALNNTCEDEKSLGEDQLF